MNAKQQRSIALGAANATPRCLARNRRGLPCQRPASSGRTRCHLHGGAFASGAPRGNKNRVVHGAYARDAQIRAAFIRGLFRTVRSMTER